MDEDINTGEKTRWRSSLEMTSKMECPSPGYAETTKRNAMYKYCNTYKSQPRVGIHTSHCGSGIIHSIQTPVAKEIIIHQNEPASRCSPCFFAWDLLLSHQASCPVHLFSLIKS